MRREEGFCHEPNFLFPQSEHAAQPAGMIRPNSPFRPIGKRAALDAVFAGRGGRRERGSLVDEGRRNEESASLSKIAVTSRRRSTRACLLGHSGQAGLSKSEW